MHIIAFFPGHTIIKICFFSIFFFYCFSYKFRNLAHNMHKSFTMHLNDAVQQTDVVSITGSSEKWRHSMRDLLRHALRTHAVVLQEQLNTAYKPAINKEQDKRCRNKVSARVSCRFYMCYKGCLFLTECC